MSKPDSLFTHHREPDSAWQADLDRIAEPGGRVNWLRIHWFPGKPYEPIQRWAIWEMIPQLEALVHDPDVCNTLLAQYDGPNPAEFGEWVPDTTVPGGKRWLSYSLISYVQWKLYQDTKREGRPCASNLTWIIQGDKGGHLYKLGPTEIAALSELQAYGWGSEDGPGADTPLPGDLPYADYDHRVASKLAERDKLRRWRQTMSWDERGMTKTEAGLIVRRERRDVEMEYNMKLLKWVEDQIETAVSDLSRVNLPQPSDFSHIEPEYVDEEEAERAFVEETSTTVEV